LATVSQVNQAAFLLVEKGRVRGVFQTHGGLETLFHRVELTKHSVLLFFANEAMRAVRTDGSLDAFEKVESD
jgi:hypothetical protein